MSPAGASDTDVDPEISVNYELGARLRRGALYGEAIGFYSDYSNTVQNCSIANPCGGQTSGSVFSGDNLAYLPEHVFNVRAGVKNGDLWDLYLNVAFVDDMCINNNCEPDPCSGTCR